MVKGASCAGPGGKGRGQARGCARWRGHPAAVSAAVARKPVLLNNHLSLPKMLAVAAMTFPHIHTCRC